MFRRNKIVLCNLNFDLYYTGLEGEFKSLFTQSDVKRNQKKDLLRKIFKWTILISYGSKNEGG